MKVFLKHENENIPDNLSEGTTYLVHHIVQTSDEDYFDSIRLKLLISNDKNELVLVDYNMFRTPPDLARFNEE